MLGTIQHIFYVLYILVDDLPMYVNKDGRPVEYIEQAVLFSSKEAMQEFAADLQKRNLVRRHDDVPYELRGAELYLNMFFTRNVLK